MWDEVIRAIPRMWTEERFSWKGKYFEMPERAVLPKPVQKPHPPMWVAVSSPETAIQAAERGMGLLGVSLGTPDEYRQRVRDYRRIIQDCEPVGKFVNNQVNGVGWMYCGESDEEAMKVGGAGAGAFMAAAAHLTGVGAVYPTPAYGAQASAIQLRTRPGDVAGPVRQSTPIGAPATVIAALKEWEAIGVDRMVFLINFDQVIPHRKILDSLRRFARDVMPAFEEPARQSLTTLPDFDAVEEVGILGEPVAAG
jgi:alkanesulfonate monooxygenase SsuD/methylene tetrahydromethanopterin reductase-like flavin-dependent oxidoreductase (luciferase family)